MEHDLSTSCTWRSWESLGDNLRLGEGELVEHWVQEFIELLRFTTKDSSFLIYHALMEQVHGNLDHSCTRTLTVTSLEKPKLALLHGELHVLHVVIVMFQLIL